MKMKDIPPVFLLSSERSGTNLLRKLLTQHQDVYFGSSPAHFLKHLFYREPYYGDLNNDESFKKMIKDALDLCYIHFSPWSIQLDADHVLNIYAERDGNERNAIYLSHLLMTLYAEEQGFTTYFCKDNNIYDFVFEILFYLPNARFIYLHRDPRDVALSQLKRSLKPDSVVKISELWEYEQVKCISAFQKLSKEQIYKLSYEDIINDSNGQIQQICEFLNIDYIKTPKDVEVSTGNSQEWENLNKPVMKKNSKKYLKELKPLQIRKIEAITSKQMHYLGYEREFENIRKLSVLEKVFDILLGYLKYFIRIKFSKNEKHQWAHERAKLLKRLSVRWRNEV
jgi:hypothetical protein